VVGVYYIKNLQFSEIRREETAGDVLKMNNVAKVDSEAIRLVSLSSELFQMSYKPKESQKEADCAAEWS
jgi:hypothetical protein